MRFPAVNYWGKGYPMPHNLFSVAADQGGAWRAAEIAVICYVGITDPKLVNEFFKMGPLPERARVRPQGIATGSLAPHHVVGIGSNRSP